jgi:hypothetical protein
MRVWSLQPLAVYDKLRAAGTLHVDPALCPALTGPEPWLEMLEAYTWVAGQMTRRGVTPPPGVTLPWWAWHTIDWEQHKPDLRRREYRGYNDQVCLELELPDTEVVLTDFWAWNAVLGQHYLGDASSTAEYDAEQAWLDTLSDEDRRSTVVESWQKVFDVTPGGNE